MRISYLLFLLLLVGCRDEETGNIIFSGDGEQVAIVKGEFLKLFRVNPVPYEIEVRCLKEGIGGYYRRGNEVSERRLIVVCGITKEELIRLIRHEYQHAVDEFRGIKTSIERESNAKKAEKVKL
jgi:hypothetical protein